jgi:hypothetical protein
VIIHPSNRERDRQMKREKNEIKKESNECQYFTLHARNGNGRKLNLQQREPMLIL